jgi:hypothetical protein
VLDLDRQRLVAAVVLLITAAFIGSRWVKAPFGIWWRRAVIVSYLIAIGVVLAWIAAFGSLSGPRFALRPPARRCLPPNAARSQSRPRHVRAFIVAYPCSKMFSNRGWFSRRIYDSRAQPVAKVRAPCAA